jgi:hypothetical protein
VFETAGLAIFLFEEIDGWSGHLPTLTDSVSRMPGVNTGPQVNAPVQSQQTLWACILLPRLSSAVQQSSSPTRPASPVDCSPSSEQEGLVTSNRHGHSPSNQIARHPSCMPRSLARPLIGPPRQRTVMYASISICFFEASPSAGRRRQIHKVQLKW